MSASLDRHITGNYGEDGWHLAEDPEPENPEIDEDEEDDDYPLFDEEDDQELDSDPYDVDIESHF